MCMFNFKKKIPGIIRTIIIINLKKIIEKFTHWILLIGYILFQQGKKEVKKTSVV